VKIMVKIGLLIGAGTVLSGCITPQAYVDPAYRKATFESVKQSAAPIPVKLQIEFQRNGAPYPKAEKHLKPMVEQVLAKSGVLTPSEDPSVTYSFNVRVNNIADIEAAKAKGFKTGLTFGGSGTVVDDNYEIKCTYAGKTGKKRDVNYQHAIHTAIGNTKERPQGLTPMKINDAFTKVVEDSVLNCLQNLQLSGEI